MPALRSLIKLLSDVRHFDPAGALQSTLFNPGNLPRVSIRLNLKLPEFFQLTPAPREVVAGRRCCLSSTIKLDNLY